MKTKQPKQPDGPSPEANVIFEAFTNSLLATVLEKPPPIERKKLLWIQRLFADPSSCPWLDAQLRKLSDVALDPEGQTEVLRSKDWRKLPGFIKSLSPNQP
jgi:hypothetical protein